MGPVSKGTLLIVLGLAVVLLQILGVVPAGFEGLTVMVFMVLMGCGRRRLPPHLRLRLDNLLDIIWSAFGVGFLGYLIGQDPLNHLDRWGRSVVVVWAMVVMAGVLAIAGYAGLVARTRNRDDAPDRPTPQPPPDTPQ